MESLVTAKMRHFIDISNVGVNATSGIGASTLEMLFSKHGGVGTDCVVYIHFSSFFLAFQPILVSAAYNLIAFTYRHILILLRVSCVSLFVVAGAITPA